MIVEVIEILLRQLNQYMLQADGSAAGAPNPALVGNISQLDRSEIATELDNHVVLSVVNLVEEKTLKNGKAFTSNSLGDVAYRNVPIHLNLYLLFTANYRNYETALKRLTQVLTFFQGKQKFTPGNSPESSLSPKPITDFSLVMDLLSLSFEEINHLWGTLGGKQIPFVVYRGRLVSISDQRILEGGGRILEIDLTSRDSTS
ncbi:MAG: DUF4255 domain-containing protein [Methylotetracoccus sp.]